jgi:serine phosphatase RsbU (regulator of sigma subunit)
MKSHTFSYGIFGVCFGFCFPIFSILMDLLVFKRLEFSLSNIAYLHTINPLHFVINTAPIFLGLAFGLAGRKQDKIIAYHTQLDKSRIDVMQALKNNEKLILDQNTNLDTTVKIKTSELQETNEELKQIVEELNATLELVKTQKYELDVKNSNITAGIYYALTIQETILPNAEVLHNIFRNYFVIFKPKDIVSGDFYYAKYIKEQNLAFAGVVDCTGHGIPGAFMSLIVSNLLTQSIDIWEIYEPSTILENMNHHFLKMFNLSEYQEGNPIGFEVTICVWQANNTKHTHSENILVKCCSSYRPVYVFRQADKKLETFIGSKLFIGNHQTQHYVAEKFITHEISVEKGDYFYLVTDGLTDQPNNKRKRLGSNTLQDNLQTIGHQAVDVQRKHIENLLANHAHKTDQRDDITLFAWEM